MKCSVLNCPCTSQADGKLITFFSLPKNDTIAKKWLRFCGNPNLKHKKYAFVCSKHFKDDDIIGGKAFEKGFRRRLRQGAVPCFKKAPESEVTKVRNNKRLATNLLASANTKEDTLQSEDNISETVEAISAEFPSKHKPYKIDNLDTESSEAVIDELSNQIKDLRMKNLRIKVNNQLLLKKYKTEVKYLRNKLQKANSQILLLKMQLEHTEE